ncbi:MAG: glycosyltransferase family 39 protein [Nitrospiraceae bacterium]|nr:glycosyltransferase family 39 protein [Nitrospiraceae bacterium]
MWRYALPLIALALFLSLFRLGAFKVFDVDEAVFAEASREMLVSGDWITPTYNFENRYDKPIMIYWLMAASYKAFGVNEFAARLPSALAGFLLALSIFFFTLTSWGEFSFARAFVKREERALYASAAFLLSLYFAAYSHAAVTDMVLSLFITLSLFAFYLSVSRRSRRFIYGFYAFSALAFLTKGLIGIVFPFGIAGVYMLMTERFKGVKKLFSFPGLILFILISFPWYIAEYMRNGQEFLWYFFVKHHFMRYTEVISGHKGPVYYYIPVLMLGLFPWIGFLPSGIANAFREKDSPGLFALIWLLFIFVFFSFSQTKLPDYILPAIPAAAILAASGLERHGTAGERFSNLLIGVLTLALGAGFILARKYLAKTGIEAGWAVWLSVPMFLMGIFSIFAVFRKKVFKGVLVTSMIAFLVLTLSSALPAANAYIQGTLYRYSIYARQNLPADGILVCYGINNPSVVFYSRHRIESIDNKGELAPLMKENRKLLLITKAKEVPGLKGVQGLELLNSNGNYALFEKK